MKVEFNSKGYPLIAVGTKSVLGFTNPDEVPNITTTTKIKEKEIGKTKYVPWFDDNSFPSKAISLIGASPVLTRAIELNTKITAGQGIVPARITELSTNGNDKHEVVYEPDICKLLNRYMIRRYIAKCGYDYFSLGNSFVKLIPNLSGNKILRIVPINARHCRLGLPESGQVKQVHVLGDWNNTDPKKLKSYTLLNEDDPLSHLNEIKNNGTLKKGPVIMHLKSDFTSNDFYAMPQWYSSKKWIDIAAKIALAIDSAMDNMLNVYIHLQIPYSYWDKKYPLDEFDGKLKNRQKKITTDIERLEQKLTSSSNTKKTLITMFGDNDTNDDKWEFDVIEKKFNQEDFVKSNAADTQTAIGSGIMPDLLGLMYGNSKGGSMQRELLLIQYALSWLDRQKLADPIELMLQFNFGDKYADVQIMFRNTFLTLLESGGGTDQNIT